jgi:hypothetical protein
MADAPTSSAVASDNKNVTQLYSLLTEKAAAEFAGVSVKTIQRLVKEGRIVPGDYGRGSHHNYRFSLETLLNVTAKEIPTRVPRRHRRTDDASIFPRVK